MLSHYPRPDRVEPCFMLSHYPRYLTIPVLTESCFMLSRTIPVLTESCFMLSHYPRPDRVLHYVISLSPS